MSLLAVSRFHQLPFRLFVTASAVVGGAAAVVVLVRYGCHVCNALQSPLK